MHVNNEIGTITDSESVGRLARDRGIPFHVDAAQSAARAARWTCNGNMPTSCRSADTRCTAPRVSAPSTSGAGRARGWSRRSTAAGHERGLRSGTLPTHQIAGMGEAARLIAKRRDQDVAHTRNLERRFLDRLQAVDRVAVNGHRTHCVPGHRQPAFRLRGERIAHGGAPGRRFLDRFGLHVGAGRAVLRAARARPGRRFRPRFRCVSASGRFTTAQEIDSAAGADQGCGRRASVALNSTWHGPCES